MKCPICKKEIDPQSRYAPFCSDRCRLIDLGNWSAEKYRIPIAADPELEQDEQDESTEDR